VGKSQKVKIFFILVIPLLILGGVYSIFYLRIQNWPNDPGRYFEGIKSTLDKYGNLSKIERGMISNQTVTKDIAEKAANIATPGLYDGILPALVTVGIITGVYYTVELYYKRKYRSNKNNVNNKKIVPEEPKSAPVLEPTVKPKTQITFFKDFNQAILTIDGLVITIVGGFLIAAGPKHFLIIYGFVILIASIISAFIANSALSSGIVNEKSDNLAIFTRPLDDFFASSHFAFWYFALGLLIIIGGIM
jgi:hypothetical protein